MRKSTWLTILFTFALGILWGCERQVNFTRIPIICQNFDVACTAEANGLIDFFNYDIKIQKAKVDILFVVDNSGSMSKEQEELADRFPQFLASISHLDYRIAITTTDVESADNPPAEANQHGALQNGRLISMEPGRNFIDNGVINAETLFKNAIQRPETKACDDSGFVNCASDDERGIYAAHLALSRNESGWVRKNSNIVVIVISDEDERSNGGNFPGFGLEPLDLPENLITKVKNSYKTNTFQAHSIIIKPGDTACLAEQDAQPEVKGFEGTFYQALSNGTGGYIGSICSDNYVTELGQIQGKVQQQVRRFKIACVPRNGINGLLVSSADTGTLSYSLEGDEVVFEEDVPAGITLNFQYRCDNLTFL